MICTITMTMKLETDFGEKEYQRKMWKKLGRPIKNTILRWMDFNQKFWPLKGKEILKELQTAPVTMKTKYVCF